ncbi:polar amino acid transport system permease protein [Mesorhizobium albiziae]|uniref:Polar amino acid transport system permease protein n=1 Tax=Neomesorhizobium albiziae TaxID=335020 RepID=A0A1I4D535_9HYPH|nr:amino acid ABC transporter permease [Mesorhizobium albiziae]GLS33668.1 amino acid ABC transporter permease [Mesorhizobium albiziae]SFK88708.1 polar amino acid transport system permease protein [Mesorhizobium albiziae]
MTYTFNFNVIWANLDQLLSGLALGLALAFFSILIGAAIGLAAAFAATGGSRFLRGAASVYVTAIRNTPLLVIVLIAYFALPELGIRMGKLESFVASLAIYAGAYLTEVFRASLIGIPAGLIDAGLSIGLTRFQVARLVRFPIMLRNALPALGSTFISLFKDTSIAAAIAIPELTFQARRINVDTFRVVEAWMAASILYLGTCLVIAAGLRRLERHFPKF